MKLLPKWQFLVALTRDPALTRLDVAVAATLVDFMGDDGRMFPGTARVAEIVGASRRGVQKSLDRLVARAWLTVSAFDAGGGHQPTIYTMGPGANGRSPRDPEERGEQPFAPDATKGANSRSPLPGTGGANAGADRGEQPCQEGRTAVRPIPLERTRLDEPEGEAVAPSSPRAREFEPSPRAISISAAIDPTDPLAPVTLVASPPFRLSRRAQAQRDWMRRELGRRQ